MTYEKAINLLKLKSDRSLECNARSAKFFLEHCVDGTPLRYLVAADFIIAQANK